MSLVNDMLRDLDQRRQGGDGSGNQVRLVPASDYRISDRKNFLPLLVIALIILTAGLGYYWVQLNQAEGPQQLDIQLQSSTPLVESNPVVEQTDSAQTDIAPPPDTQPAPAVVEIAEAVSEPAAVETAIAETIAVEIAVEEPIIEAEPVLQASAELLQGGTEESVKDDAVMSPEQEDRIAVQAALRLIADNKGAEAYQLLEEYILSNRYAHQSRETYAKLLMSEGSARQAYELLEAGLTLAPNHTGFKKVKARLLLSDGQIGQVVELLLSRAPEVSADLEYHEILALAQLTSRDYQGASLSYTSLVQQDQTQGRWWYGFAASQDSLGNLVAARQAYFRAMQFGNLSASLRRRSQNRLDALGQ